MGIGNPFKRADVQFYLHQHRHISLSLQPASVHDGEHHCNGSLNTNCNKYANLYTYDHEHGNKHANVNTDRDKHADKYCHGNTGCYTSANAR